MDSFQEIIQYLVCGVNPISDINEIAIVMSVAPSTVYGYRNQGTEPKFSQIIALNRFLVDQKDCYIIEKAFGITNRPHPYDRIQAIKEELAALEAEIAASN